jgi:excisionase family DNA binding protein
MEREDSDPLLTVAEVAQDLGCSASTVRNLIHFQQLRALVKRNSVRPSFRVRRSDLEAYKRDRILDSMTDDWE